MRGRIALLAATLVVACSGDEVTADDLKRRRFAVTEVAGDAPREVREATFRFANDRLSWGGICNSIGGEYLLQEGRVGFTAGGGTLRGCEPEALMTADGWVADFLEAGPEVDLDGDVLTLRGEDATIVAEDSGELTGSNRER